MSAQGDSLKSIIYALTANGAIAVAKFVAAFITGSGSMLAEAIHSSADCGNQLLLLFGMKQAKKAPNDDYPLGYGKETYFWSFIVAIMLFSLGGLFSIYEGVHKLHHPEPLSQVWIAIAVLIFAIVAESVSMWGCLREVNKSRGDRNLWQWFQQTRQSELLVIFGEDLAALLGLVFALIAVVLALVTGNPMFDAVGGIVIGCFLIVIAGFIAVEVKAMLIGQGVDPLRKKEMMGFLAAQSGIEKIYNLLTLQMGADVMVAIKAKMQDGLSAHDLVNAINATEVRFRQSFPEVKWLFFEPDNHD
jgi:cation diffusion facilitator family transporter